MSRHVPVAVRELGGEGWRLCAQGRIWRLSPALRLREAGSSQEREVASLDAAKALVRAACRPEACGRLECAWCREAMGEAPGLPAGQTSHGICPGCRELVEAGGSAWVVRYLSTANKTAHEVFRFGVLRTDLEAEREARAWAAEGLPRRGGALRRIFRLP